MNGYHDLRTLIVTVKRQGEAVIEIGHSHLGTDTWLLHLNRKLTPVEMKHVSDALERPATQVWDERGKEFSLPSVLLCVRKVCPDVEARSWKHEPIKVRISSQGLPPKVYEIENAMTYYLAEKKAKEAWKEQYGHLGVAATIITVRLATKRDLKGMM